MKRKSIIEKERRYINNIFTSSTNNFKYAEGIRKLEALSKKYPALNSEDLLCKLAFLYDHLALREKNEKRRKADENIALRLYHRVLRLNPESSRATWGIGRVLWHRNDKRAIKYALRAYRLCKKLGKPVRLYAQNIGLIYEAIENFRRAEYWLLRGAQENRRDFGSYLNLVVFYRLVHKFDKAIKWSKQLEKLYLKESGSFKNTPWGKKIAEVIKDANKPLKLKKGGSL